MLLQDLLSFVIFVELLVHLLDVSSFLADLGREWVYQFE